MITVEIETSRAIDIAKECIVEAEFSHARRVKDAIEKRKSGRLSKVVAGIFGEQSDAEIEYDMVMNWCFPQPSGIIETARKLLRAIENEAAPTVSIDTETLSDMKSWCEK